MKSFKDFILEDIETVDAQLYSFLFEESAAASTMTSGVDNPDAAPVFKKSKFMETDCLEVDSNTYANCIQGKIPFKRWKKYVEDNSLESELKKMYHRNKKLLIKDAKTGSMTFIK